MKKKLFWLIGILGILSIALVVFNATRTYTSKFTGPVSVDDPLPAELVSDLEQYVKYTMKKNDVPGVSMVLVHDDKVVYLNAMGVKDLETKEPMKTDTLMGIGSTTKSMTAVMVASLVDEGIINWDTPVTEIWPAFALSDPGITEKVTFEHTLCMCSGVPERKEEFTVRYSEMSAEEIIESLANFPLEGEFEQTFNYSQRMLSAGGYLAGMAAGGDYGNLADAYTQVMQERILDPLEMTSSTFSIQQAVASGNYATPYYTGVSGFHATPTGVEGIFTPIAPAGALWSTAEDMSKYLNMLLNQGVAENGTRVVSAENLEYLWERHVLHDTDLYYGLGWEIEDFNGLTVIHHPGGTVGYASELAVIPELNVGFALLTNRLDLTAPIGRMAYYRLLEMLTGSEQTYDKEVADLKLNVSGQLLTLSVITKKTVDSEEISPFLGAYHNETLGDAELLIHNDRTLWLDIGEYEIPLRKLKLEKNQFIFYESVFMGKALVLDSDSAEHPTLSVTGNEGTTYLFTSMLSDPDR
jgi:CubicO group peptidase (beta-lactamase class C family)